MISLIMRGFLKHVLDGRNEEKMFGKGNVPFPAAALLAHAPAALCLL